MFGLPRSAFAQAAQARQPGMFAMPPAGEIRRADAHASRAGHASRRVRVMPHADNHVHGRRSPARPLVAHSAAGSVSQARHAERMQQLPHEEVGAVGGRCDRNMDRQAGGELPAFRGSIARGFDRRSWRARRAADGHRRQGAAGHRPRERHRSPGPPAHAGNHRCGVARIERQRRRRPPRRGRGAGRHRTGDAAAVSCPHARRSGPCGQDRGRARPFRRFRAGTAAKRASGIRQGPRRIHCGTDLQRGPPRRQDESWQHLRAAARRRRGGCRVPQGDRDRSDVCRRIRKPRGPVSRRWSGRRG